MLIENQTHIPEPFQSAPVYELVQASSGKRFFNYLIDLILVVMIVVFWMFIAAIVSPSSIESLDDSEDVFGSFADRIIGLIVYAITLSLIEVMFRGKSLGKLITGTKAVNHDGSDISFGTAFARGFSRVVPFEALSALGNPSYPWHDKWTNTYVIDEKATRLYNQQIQNS